MTGTLRKWWFSAEIPGCRGFRRASVKLAKGFSMGVEWNTSTSLSEFNRELLSLLWASTQSGVCVEWQRTLLHRDTCLIGTATTLLWHVSMCLRAPDSLPQSAHRMPMIGIRVSATETATQVWPDVRNQSHKPQLHYFPPPSAGPSELQTDALIYMTFEWGGLHSTKALCRNRSGCER